MCGGGPSRPRGYGRVMGLERWHVGPWTARGTVEGEAFEAGQKRTPDELNFDVVGLSRILGR
ncbi:MAG: hypothetical protein QOH03_2315, partial [Kribbellaceae bacterium]|nr:hypothetical protein [Kribbellaceae bacterium]